MSALYLPPELRKLIGHLPYTADDIGLSGSTVLLYDDMVLKVRPVSDETRSERDILRWMCGKLNVPEVIFSTEEQGCDYLLMSRIKGKMSCDEEFLTQPEKLVTRLADCLHQLWAVDISDCPVNCLLDSKLAQAEHRVLSGMVDMDNAEPETYGENGFKNPAHLLEWLRSNRPSEESVLSHGDFCLPNIFFGADGTAGCIDLGRAGIADRWLDIALCLRSLKHNFDGVYSGVTYEGFEPQMFFDALGIEPDWEKINYYILLDELF